MMELKREYNLKKIARLFSLRNYIPESLRECSWIAKLNFKIKKSLPP